MIALPIISIVFCYAYIIFILFKYGVPVSLSETYYLLPVKWDWLFSAWTVMTSLPIGIYWFMVAPPGLKWIPVTVALALLMIGVADCYKSGPKRDYMLNGTEPKVAVGKSGGRKKFVEFFKELFAKFNPKEFFKYGFARLIHYTNSLIAIILTTVYICLIGGATTIAYTIISYVIFIIIGLKVPGVYNQDYSTDVDHQSWIFFMEIVCLNSIFVFLWMA